MKKIVFKKKHLIIASSVFLAIVMLLVILCLILIDNSTIVYQDFYIKHNNNDNSNNIKIAHLSDMHFPKIKVDTQRLLKRLDEQDPDIIAITGDLIDGSAKIEDCGVYEFIDKLKDIAPIYYVNGNHEANHKHAIYLYEHLLKNGAVLLNNQSKNVRINNTRVTIIGLNDNTDYNSSFLKYNKQAKDNYKILLAHRPEKWRTYTSDSNTIKPHLVLAGHAHGGQFRLLNTGLYAPNQGLFPKYDSGLFTDKKTNIKMIVSRGIGNSLFPFRSNNKPHVPIITISL